MFRVHSSTRHPTLFFKISLSLSLSLSCKPIGIGIGNYKGRVHRFRSTLIPFPPPKSPRTFISAVFFPSPSLSLSLPFVLFFDSQ